MPDFKTFINRLKQNLALPLPGIQAQLSMVPPTRKKELKAEDPGDKAKPSAVLILLYSDEGNIYFPLIQRATYNGIHSGQVAFPGGQYETKDKDLKITALREAREEINTDSQQIGIIGELTPLYIPPSNFVVYPFVGFTTKKPGFKVDNTETKAVIEVKLSDFLYPGNRTVKTIHHRTGKDIEVPCFYLNNKIVWGATAMILSELYAVIERN